MAWWAVAAAAVPYIASALQDKPKAPEAPAPVKMTNRDSYVSDMLDTAYNQDSKTWELAADKSADNVARALGRRGLGGSSIGGQILIDNQAALAQAWLEQAAQRKRAALDSAVGYDRGQAGFANDQANQQYGYAMDAYGRKVKSNADQIAGLSGMIQAGMGAYNTDRMISAMEARNAPVASYGTPGGSIPSGPTYMQPANNQINGGMSA